MAERWAVVRGRRGGAACRHGRACGGPSWRLPPVLPAGARAAFLRRWGSAAPTRRGSSARRPQRARPPRRPLPRRGCGHGGHACRRHLRTLLDYGFPMVVRSSRDSVPTDAGVFLRGDVGSFGAGPLRFHVCGGRRRRRVAISGGFPAHADADGVKSVCSPLLMVELGFAERMVPLRPVVRGAAGEEEAAAALSNNFSRLLPPIGAVLLRRRRCSRGDLYRSFLEESGWVLVPTSGGSVPLSGSSSLGDLGFLEFFGASDHSSPDDAMVHDHRLQPVRSTILVHVASDVLLKTAPKIHVLRQGGGRLQAGSSGRRRQGQPGDYKDLNVISISFEGVFVIWAVITRSYE